MTIFEASPTKSAVPGKLQLPDRRKCLEAADGERLGAFVPPGSEPGRFVTSRPP